MHNWNEWKPREPKVDLFNKSSLLQ